jgi:hypothetical protein
MELNETRSVTGCEQLSVSRIVRLPIARWKVYQCELLFLLAVTHNSMTWIKLATLQLLQVQLNEWKQCCDAQRNSSVVKCIEHTFGGSNGWCENKTTWNLISSWCLRWYNYIYVCKYVYMSSYNLKFNSKDFLRKCKLPFTLILQGNDKGNINWKIIHK